MISWVCGTGFEIPSLPATVRTYVRLDLVVRNAQSRPQREKAKNRHHLLQTLSSSSALTKQSGCGCATIHPFPFLYALFARIISS